MVASNKSFGLLGGSKLRDYGDPCSANVILPKQFLVETIKSAVSTDAGPGVEDRRALAERMMLGPRRRLRGLRLAGVRGRPRAGPRAEGDPGQVAARLLQRPAGADQRRRADLLHDQGDHEPAGAVRSWSSTSGTSTSPTTAPTRSTSRPSGGPIAWCTASGSTRSRCRSTGTSTTLLVVPELGRDGDMLAATASPTTAAATSRAAGSGCWRSARACRRALVSERPIKHDGRRADRGAHPRR